LRQTLLEGYHSPRPHPSEDQLLLSRYRVDNVPRRLRIPFLVYGYAFGALWYAYVVLLRLTLKVRVTGIENVPNGSNFILCQWHETGPLAVQTWAPRLPAYLAQRPHAWIVHSDWYTKPVWVVLSLLGVQKLVPASKGNGRRAAAEEIVSYLRKGYSTFVTPDGPKGPARALKKGVLHMSEQSGVPILPVRFTVSRFHRTASWDRKIHPLPFSTVHVAVGTPIAVTTSTFNESIEALTDALG
jgi:lysophospholipid acyltransferase (LPLAT)-like uncharacterized protein